MKALMSMQRVILMLIHTNDKIGFINQYGGEHGRMRHYAEKVLAGGMTVRQAVKLIEK